MNNRFLPDLKKAVSQAVHQCNNHLSIILSNCEMMLASNDPETSKKKLESCIDRIAHITELLFQLNRFTGVNTEIKPSGLRSLFENPLREIEARAKELKIAVTIHVVADGVAPVPSHVFQLLIELVGVNAIHAAKTGVDPKIAFEVLQMNGEVTILAANSGKEPDSASEKFAFNSYFSDRNLPVFEALASVKSLTELLGGHVVYQKNNGRNEVHLKLPLQFEGKTL